MTWSISGVNPSGYTSRDTHQSPRPEVSSRREPNHPSSSTNRSMPTAAATSASSRRVSRSWRKYTASHVFSNTGRGEFGCAGLLRTARWKPHVAGVNPPDEYTPTTAGVVYDSPGSSTTSPGWSSSPACTYLRPSANRSASIVWLPLHARWTPCTSPIHSPKPDDPANNSGTCSCDVRPRRCSDTSAPWVHVVRAGWNSRAQRPSNRSSSSAESGSGRLTVNASSE